MGFCQKCGEIVRNTSGICEACKTTSVESAASGMTASGNQGDGYSNKYLSSGLNAGVEKGIRRMLGEDPGVKEECIDCGRKLEKESEVFVGPSEKGGHVYCEPCYSGHFKKGDCQACRKPVLGLGREYVQQEGKFWHKDCFNGGKACKGCSKVIFGSAIEALGSYYHPACFVCINCQNPINGTFLDHNSFPCCRTCYDYIQKSKTSPAGPNYVTATRSPSGSKGPSEIDAAHAENIRKFGDRLRLSKEDAGVTCAGCGKAIEGGTVAKLGEERLYHSDCLKCSECNKPVKEKYVMEKGNVFHPECRVTVSSATLACSKCSKPITAKFLKVDDAVWHQECFTCADCNKSLSNEGFSTTSDGSNVCDICLKARNVGQPKTAPGWTYNQRTGLKELRGAGGVKLGEQAGLKALGAKSVCPACEKTVYMAEEVPGPMGSKWHRACLRCKGCRSQLDSHAKLRDNMPYCRNCFSTSATIASSVKV